ncbi:hypothetical protein [Salipiger sp. PrR007]|uniref:hypothetical protein n=1 Tax=Salipiger sp. PrR007 TaxID=2706884 RepID=UPI0013BB5954|nr:hypothetical protein [Salipiger sp. PrR007]NDW31526.1 hypothetical protein [Salipiger sp. PrR007]
MAVLIWDLSSRLTEQRVRNEEGAKASREQTTDRIELHCGTDLSPTLLRRCLEDEIEAGDDAKRAERNLQSQKEVALFTRIMGYTGIAGIVVGFLSVVLVYFTLRETRRMASDTREIGEAQAQAYVTASKAEFRWGSPARDAPQVHIRFQNIGQTPVKWFQFRTHPMLFSLGGAGDAGLPQEWPSNDLLGDFSKKWSYVDGSTAGSTVSIRLLAKGITVRQLESARPTLGVANSHGLAIFGEVRYCTFFNDIYLSQFVFGLNWLRDFRGDRTVVEQDGADLTITTERPQKMSAFPFEMETYQLKCKNKRVDH